MQFCIFFFDCLLESDIWSATIVGYNGGEKVK